MYIEIEFKMDNKQKQFPTYFDNLQKCRVLLSKIINFKKATLEIWKKCGEGKWNKEKPSKK